MNATWRKVKMAGGPRSERSSSEIKQAEHGKDGEKSGEGRWVWQGFALNCNGKRGFYEGNDGNEEKMQNSDSKFWWQNNKIRVLEIDV